MTVIVCIVRMTEIPAGRARIRISICEKKRLKNRGLSGLGCSSRYWRRARGVELVETVPAGQADRAAAVEPLTA